MPKISDTARVTPSRGSHAPDVQDELAYNAYCVAEAVKTELKRSGADGVTRGGMPGLEGKVSVPTILKLLWPGIFGGRSGAYSDDAKQVRIALYDYLRATKNLICISPDNMREMSTWWVRLDWSDEPPPEKPGSPGMGASQEPHDSSQLAVASQNRSATGESGNISQHNVAGQGTIATAASHPCPHCNRPFSNTKALTRHVFAEHEDLADLILEGLAMQSAPTTIAALSAFLAGTFGYIGSPELLRRRLIIMTSVPGIVITTTNGRKQYSLSEDPSDDLYERTMTALMNRELITTVKCREPGCGKKFRTTSSRTDHEDRYHRRSSWRVWTCPICITPSAPATGHPETFYSLVSWAIHMSRLHGMATTDPAYQSLRRDAIRASTAVNSKLLENPPAVAPAPEPEPEPEPPVQQAKRVTEPIPPVVVEDTTPAKVEVPPVFPVDDDGIAAGARHALDVMLTAYGNLIIENAELRQKLLASGPAAIVEAANSTEVAELKAENAELRQRLEDVNQQLDVLRKVMSGWS